METTSKTSTLAVVSLVFGLLGWTALPVIGSLIAIVTGHMARTEIQQSFDSIQGDGLAVAGLVLGWIPIIMLLLAIVAAAFVTAGILSGSIVLLILSFVVAVFLMTFVLA